MRDSDVIEQAAQVVHVAIAHRWMTVCSALREDRDYPELLRDIARSLDNAGLLARPLPDRDEVAIAMYEVLSPHYGDFRYPYAAADAVLDLMKGQDR